MQRSHRQILHVLAFVVLLGVAATASPQANPQTPDPNETVPRDAGVATKGALAATMEAAAVRDAPGSDTIQAIWRVHRLNFVYHSQDVYYDCQALQGKIADILRAVGAHRHVQVALHCTGGQMVKYAHARLTLALPEEATEANVTAATTFDTRARMAARLRKLTLPTPSDIERFPARWQTVRLSRQHRVNLEAGDCDLLRDMRRQVFPKLPVHITRHDTSCTPGAATRIRPKLEIVALIAERPPVTAGHGATPSG